MKKKVSLMIGFIALISTSVLAQLEIGASYELRDEDPKSGFGVRIEKGFLDQVPLADLSLRAHFSFFSDENKVNEGALSYSQEIMNYDFGVAGIVGVSVGLIEPYLGLGLGLGSTTLDIGEREYNAVASGLTESGDASESNIYWNAIIGSKVSITPLVKPFVEYRYSNTSLSDPELAEVATGRIIFGVSLSF